ncbi:uncharacterized protein LOC111212930 [Brassica napus]|uniref:uncharacterized protein LOC111212930 n=1 Tax=Brassica napus TaxID=3708 RepID=UPI000BBEDA7C|nr:uncharacterized protein LOC111212930 [Brassica napus]
MDGMESKFQDILHGTRNVRDYGDEFNRLRRFAGHYLSDHDLVRRFLKGMMIELRNSCNVRDYRDVHELIEKAAEQETGLEEERRRNQASQNQGAKRPRDSPPLTKTAPARAPCGRCGRLHPGECRMGACYNYGQHGHIARDCLRERQGRPEAAHRGRCYHCGQEGSVAVGGVTSFTLFDTGATQSFVSPKLTREWNFKGNFNTMVTGVETAGTEKMATRGKYEEVPVILAVVNLPGDLLELELGRYEVILGMDWLAQHRAVVECAKACVWIPLEGRQIVYKGMRTRTRVSVISMVHAEEAIRREEKPS